MKIIFIVYGSAIDIEMMDGLAELAVKKYTKFPDILGCGGTAEPRLGDNVWPGTNQGLLIAADEPNTEKILNLVKKLRAEYSREGVKAFVIPLEEEV